MWGRAKTEAFAAIRRRERAESRRRLPIAIQSAATPRAGHLVAEYRADHSDAGEEELRAAFVAESRASREEWINSGAGPYVMSFGEFESFVLAEFEATLAADAHLVKPYSAADLLEVVARLLALETARSA
jgi:hypothetical protein